MYIFLILAIVFAALQAYATYKGLRRFEFIAKPVVMICLFIWLALATRLQNTVLWFGFGVLFSLIGDVLLLWPERFFLHGLVAFLFAQIFYIIGFRDEFTTISIGSVLLAAILAVSVVLLMRRIVSSMRAKGQASLVVPVMIYSIVISLMLYAAISTIFDTRWKSSAAILAAVGAFFFYISDLVLAWNKFVSPITHGRVLNILLYHAGQMMIVAGVINQIM